MIYHYTGLHTSLTFRCQAYYDSAALSGSVIFGLQDPVTNKILASNIIDIPAWMYEPVTGSIDLTGLGLTEHQPYKVFSVVKAFGLSGSAYMKDRYITADLDDTQFGGSGSAGNLYVNSGGTAPTDPDGYIYFSKAVGAGYDDEARWLMWDNDYNSYLIEGVGAFKTSHALVIRGSDTVVDAYPSGRLIIEPRISAANYHYSDILFSGSAEGNQGVFQYTNFGDANFLFRMNNQLDMSVNKIIRVVDPTSNQEVATKKYVDDQSGGSVGTLQQVTDNGATTNNAITVSASGSSFSNLTVYNDLTVGGEQWVNGILHTGTDVRINGGLQLNYDGPEGDVTIHFYENGSPTGAYLRWDDSTGYFRFNQPLDMFFSQIHNVTDPTSNQDAATKKYVDDAAGGTLDSVCKNGSQTDHGILVNASGSKFYSLTIASGSLDMAAHTIVNVSDPVNNQDAATKAYVDTVSGSIGTDLNDQVHKVREYVDDSVSTVSGSCAQSLQGVTNIGNTTTDDITAANLKSNANIYANHDGGDGDSFIYFYDGGSPTGRYLKWTDGSTRFDMNSTLVLSDDLFATDVVANNNMYVNYDGAEGDSFIYFYEGGSTTGAYLKWHDISTVFQFSHALSMNSQRIVLCADPLFAQDAATKNYVDTVSGSIGTDLNNQIHNVREYVDDEIVTVSGSIGVDLNHQILDARAYTDTVSGSIGDDLNNQIHNTREYVDDSVAAAGNLQQVTDSGPYTNNAIYVDASGSKFYSLTIASGSLDMAAHTIVNVSDPTNPQDAATKEYVDNIEISGSVGTLQQVTDNGATTTNDITAANLKSNANIYVNHDGGDGDSYVYFYEGGSPTKAHLKWDDSSSRFEFSTKLHLPNKINFEMASGFSTRTLTVDDSMNQPNWKFSDDIGQAGSKFYINYDGGDSDAYIFFYDGGSPTGKFLKWNNASSLFNLNGTLIADGDLFGTDVVANNNMYVNYNGGEVDSYVYFYENGSTTGAHLKWDTTNNRHAFSHGVYIPSWLILTGNITSTGGNVDIQNGDVDIQSGDFTVNGSTYLGDGGTTDYTEVKADGEINLHGTARVTKHIRVTAPSWHKGASAPSDGDIGLWHTLDFDGISDDEVHYEFLVPFDMASGSTIDVAVDWAYTGGQDDGTVCWAIQYDNAVSGSSLTGAGTTISETTPGYQMQDRLIRTSFTTGIIGTTAHDSLALHFYRDVSGDTMSAWAKMIGVYFTYTSDKLGEAT